MCCNRSLVQVASAAKSISNKVTEFCAHHQHDFCWAFPAVAWCQYNKLQQTLDRKKQIGWKKLPILIVSSHPVETCNLQNEKHLQNELALFSQHNPNMCFWSLRSCCKILRECEDHHIGWDHEVYSWHLSFQRGLYYDESPEKQIISYPIGKSTISLK